MGFYDCNHDGRLEPSELTLCCGASLKGGENGIVCRHCYRDNPPTKEATQCMDCGRTFPKEPTQDRMLHLKGQCDGYAPACPYCPWGNDPNDEAQDI